MPYRFEQARRDFSLFSPGGVFYALPGHTAFPVRLAAEIFAQCAGLLAESGHAPPYHLYDPCCGGAYHLAVLAFLQPGAFSRISASDIDPDALSLAGRNLSLLNPAGLEQREQQLADLYTKFKKPSHASALQQAAALRELLAGRPAAPEVRIFQADALQPEQVLAGLGGEKVDLVISDVPYGWKSAWEVAQPDVTAPPVWRMLEALRGCLAPHAIVAVAAGKDQPIRHERYRQLRHIKIGRRQVVILNNHAAAR